MALEPTIPHNLHSPVAESLEQQFTPVGMTRTEFRAMGTTVALLLPQEHYSWATHEVQSLFATWEQTLSRFLPDSDLSRLNQHAGRPVKVSGLLFTVLETALRAAQATEGLYDPTLLPQLRQLGYDRSFDEIVDRLPANKEQMRPGGGWREIQMDRQRRQVTLPKGVSIEVGGIAKGMAVDAALEHLRMRGLTTALVNAGGDLAVLGVPPVEQQWPIAVQGRTISWIIPLRSGALATSGIARRHWQQGNQMRHHLLDPRTGMPSQSGLWSVTVAASRCTQAEVAAKVAFLLGAEQGWAFLLRHGLAGVLVRNNGAWATAGPWPVESMV
jgi:thiamine biosynthesis lipoprotein